MRTQGAIAGGEGSGGVILPAVNAARDSYVGIALVLELMAKEQKPLSKIAASLPSYTMVKEKVPRAGDTETIYAKLRAEFPEASADTTDGLRLNLENHSWVSIRPSNTEPILRIFAEAKTREMALELSSRAQKALRP
jgi:phosphomannomutase